MKYILLILTITLLYSCDIQKQSAKRKTDTSVLEGFEQREYRQSDNIRYTPPANVILRDTTIVVVSDKGTTLRMAYDSNGNVREAECLPALIELVTKMSKQFEQSEKDKSKDKEEKFNSTWILYIMIAVIALGCFFLFLMYKSINKNSNAVISVVNALNDRNLQN